MDDDILKAFIDESFEHLADIENDLLEMERAGAQVDMELVNKVYRAAHSIKGGAGFMDLRTIKDLTHEMENVLGKVRAGELVPTPEIVGALLSASDTLKALLADVANSNDADISSHLEELRAQAEGKEAATNRGESPPVEDVLRDVLHRPRKCGFPGRIPGSPDAAGRSGSGDYRRALP